MFQMCNSIESETESPVNERLYCWCNGAHVSTRIELESENECTVSAPRTLAFSVIILVFTV
jgi:hypothetical protein